MQLYIIPTTDSPDADKYIIYRPLTGVAFVGNRAITRLLQAIADESAPFQPAVSKDVETFLRTAGFFQPDPAPPASMNSEFRPTIAVLLMTNQCQLRCTYCYAAAGESPRQELTFELGRAAIDQVCQNAIDLGLPDFEISFHGGGEPTYAWTVLQECAAYARQKPRPAKLTLTSNGVWSSRQQDWILNTLDSVSISMDGTPATQDRQRPFKSGGESSSYVLRTLAALDSHKFPYGIRLTATAPWTNLPDDVRFICENTNCQAMQVEPAFNIKRGGHSWPDESEAQSFADAYLAAVDIVTRAGRRLQFSGARLGTVTATFCTAPYSALIVNGSGHLVACYEVASDAHTLSQLSIMGRVEDNAVIVDEDARARLHRLISERQSTCGDCFCYWSCAGDCYARAFSTAPNGHLFHSGRCAMNRSITRELLLRRIAASDGVWYASKDSLALHFDGTGKS